MSRSIRLPHNGSITRRRFLGLSLLGATTLGAAATALWRGGSDAGVQRVAGAPRHWVTSPNRTAGFDDFGNLVALGRDGDDVPLAIRRSGLSLHDPDTNETVWVLGAMREERDTVLQVAGFKNKGLSVEALYRFLEDETLEVQGWVADNTGRDRVLDVAFSVPIEMDSTSWQPRLLDHQPLRTKTRVQAQEHMPVAVLGAIGGEYDLAFSVPPENPVLFEIQPDPENQAFSLRLKFGLSSAAGGALRSRAPFRFMLDILPAGAGLRLALDRYYARHPEAFASRVRRYGFWQIAPRDAYARPQYYGFHETGYARGKARNLAEYERNDGWGLDEEAGVYTLAYTLVGQGEITNLPVLPENYNAALQALTEWTGSANFFGGPSPELPNSYTDVDQHKQIIENSALHVSADRLHLVRRTTAWGGNSVTFPLNPNPNLGPPSPTIAQYMLDQQVPQLLRSAKVDGIYVDSLEAWGNFYNYRRAHFASARIPLTYQNDRRQPALYNSFSHQEYLWELRRRLHAASKVLMGNGVSETCAFNAFALDVICAERSFESLLIHESRLAFYRTVARQKPVLLMIYEGWEREQDVERLWKWALLYGIFVSSGPQNVEYVTPVNEVRYQDKYASILIRLAKAGWQPRTGISTTDPRMRIERYGDGSHFFIVMYNTAPSAAQVSMQVDTEVVLSGGVARLRDVLVGEDLSTDVLSGAEFRIGADEVRVLEIWETDPQGRI